MESRIGLKPPKEPQPNTYWRRKADIPINTPAPSFIRVRSVEVGYKKMGFKDVIVTVVGGVDYATRSSINPIIRQYSLHHKEFINTYSKIDEDILSEVLGLEILASL